MRKLRRLLASAEGKLKALTVVCGLVLITLVITASSLAITSTPTFCSLCHEMRPEYYTWQASAHNKIACVDCHIKPGAKNFVEHKVESLVQVYDHFTGNYTTPIEMAEPISNSQCEQCHDMTTRVTTPPGDIKFPHEKHLAQNVACVDCHSGVAHADIEEKGFTTITNFNSWTTLKGAAYLKAGFNTPKMSLCIDCHNDRNVSVTCDTCHTKFVKPVSHSDSSWLTIHGRQALKDIDACDKCHLNTSGFGENKPSDVSVQEYVRQNTFCNGCHAKEPAGHIATWRKTHAAAATPSRTGCFICHNEAPSQFPANAPATVYCQECHSQPHTRQIGDHPIPIPASGYGPECLKCHKASTCETCHIKVSK